MTCVRVDRRLAKSNGSLGLLSWSSCVKQNQKNILSKDPRPRTLPLKQTSLFLVLGVYIKSDLTCSVLDCKERVIPMKWVVINWLRLTIDVGGGEKRQQKIVMNRIPITHIWSWLTDKTTSIAIRTALRTAMAHLIFEPLWTVNCNSTLSKHRGSYVGPHVYPMPMIHPHSRAVSCSVITKLVPGWGPA